MADIPKFRDGEPLRAVREKTLEPLVDAVNFLVPKVEEIEVEARRGILDASLDPNAKKITLTKKVGNPTELDFQPWFDGIPTAMDVQEDGKAPIPGIDKLKFSGLEVTGPTDEGGKKTATITYTPPDLSISGTVDGVTESIDKIIVSGPGGSTVTKGTLSIVIPPSGGADAHKSMHKFYRVATIDMMYAHLMRDYAYSIRDKQLLLTADSHGMGDIADEDTIIPYDGKFNLSGRFAMEGWTGTAINSQWVFKVARIRTDVTTVIYEATYDNTNQSKIHLPPIKWDFKGVDLLAGDKLVYYFECLNDTTFATAYPALRILPHRSYFVVEDAKTVAGSRIAETQRKLQGPLNTKDSVGINIYYASGTSGTIRTTSTAIPNEYNPMTQV